jgi:hypothetical protein
MAAALTRFRRAVIRVWRFAVTVRYVPAPTGQQYGGNFSKCCPVDAGILLVPCMPNKPNTIHGNNAFEGVNKKRKPWKTLELQRNQGYLRRIRDMDLC